MSDFEWQTEEEWQEEITGSAETKRPWWSWLLLVITFVVIGGVVVWQLNSRVRTTVEAVEEDIIASYELFYRAVEDGDTELAFTLLSGSNSDWTKQEQARITAGNWLRWPELGWQLVGEPEIGEVEIGSDLRSAEITLALLYEFNGTRFTLQRTLTFRQGTTHWLYAPPAPEFWGEQKTLEGDVTNGLQLNFFYPEHDAELIETLHLDINRTLAKIPSFSGNDLFNISPTATVFFGTQSLHFPYLRATADTVDSITLPSPSNIGLPINNSGYQALLATYTTHLLTFPAAAQAGYACCNHAVFGQALGEHLLTAHGVSMSQLTAQDYTRVLQGNGGFNDRLLGWESAEPTPPTTDEWRTARALVEYLHEAIPIHAVSLHMGKNLRDVASFDEWFQHVAQIKMLSSVMLDDSEPSFAGFQAFLIERGAAMVDDSPYALPAAQPVVACLKADGGSRLYGYDFATYSWDALWESAERIENITTLGSTDALWIEQATSLAVWRKASSVTQPIANVLDFSADWQTPDTPLVFVRQPPSDDPEIDNFYWLDLNQCEIEEQTDCGMTAINGIPRWAPDREHLLFIDSSRNQLTLTDSNRNVLYVRADIPDLDSVLWIDDTHYSWRNPIDDAHYRSSIDNSEIEQWFTVSDLGLPTPLSEQRLYIYPAGRANDPYLLIMQIFEGDVPQHLFSYNHVTGETHYLDALSYNEYVGLSPEGRYVLAVRARPSTVMRLSTSLNLFDRVNDTFYSYTYGEPAALSDDWLLLSQSNRLRLIAPSERYERLIPLPADNCTDAAWLLEQ